MKKLLLFALLSSIFALNANATHIKAGEFMYKKISARSYETTFYEYTKTSSNVPRDQLIFQWGDNTRSHVSLVNIILNATEDTELRIYRSTHTFIKNGTYVVSVSDENRNKDIVNINNGNSQNFSFYTDCEIHVADGLDNSSVQFSSMPTIAGTPFDVYTCSMTAYDPDGDYLTYRLIPCRDSLGSIPSYTFPNGISINPVSGLITWDKPTKIDQYAFAVRIAEWRNGVVIGATTRDFQVIVSPNAALAHFNTNNWPKDTTGNYVFTVNPNNPVTLKCAYTDNILDSVNREVYVFSETLINPNTATTLFTNKSDSSHIEFTWMPQGFNTRCAPYVVTFRGKSSDANKIVQKDIAALIYVRDTTTNNCTAPDVNKDQETPHPIIPFGNIKLYPNPAGDIVVIEISNGLTDYQNTCIIVNYAGQEIYKQTFIGNTLSFNRNMLPDGIYVCRITSEKGTQSIKLFLE